MAIIYTVGKKREACKLKIIFFLSWNLCFIKSHVIVVSAARANLFSMVYDRGGGGVGYRVLKLLKELDRPSSEIQGQTVGMKTALHLSVCIDMVICRKAMSSRFTLKRD